MPASIIGGALSAGGSLLGGLFGKKSSGNPYAQYDTMLAIQLQQVQQQQQQALQQQIQQNLAPFVSAGQGAEGQLSGLMDSGYFQPQNFSFNPSQAGLTSPSQGSAVAGPNGIATYQAPQAFSYAPFSFTQSDFQQSPGYQFQLEQGIDAARNAASSSGGRFSGNLLSALDQYGTGLANQDWYKAYNQALGTYTTNFGNALQSYDTNATLGANTFNTNFNNDLTGFNTNNQQKTQLFNMLQAIAASGQSAAAGQGGIAAQIQGLGQNSANAQTNALANLGLTQNNNAIGGSNALGNGINNALTSLGGSIMSAFNNPSSNSSTNANSGGGLFSSISSGLQSLFNPSGSSIGNVLNSPQGSNLFTGVGVGGGNSY